MVSRSGPSCICHRTCSSTRVYWRWVSGSHLATGDDTTDSPTTLTTVFSSPALTSACASFNNTSIEMYIVFCTQEVCTTDNLDYKVVFDLADLCQLSNNTSTWPLAATCNESSAGADTRHGTDCPRKCAYGELSTYGPSSLVRTEQRLQQHAPLRPDVHINSDHQYAGHVHHFGPNSGLVYETFDVDCPDLMDVGGRLSFGSWQGAPDGVTFELSTFHGQIDELSV